jgi:hypothetical protein
MTLKTATLQEESHPYLFFLILALAVYCVSKIYQCIKKIFKKNVWNPNENKHGELIKLQFN